MVRNKHRCEIIDAGTFNRKSTENSIYLYIFRFIHSCLRYLYINHLSCYSSVIKSKCQAHVRGELDTLRTEYILVIIFISYHFLTAHDKDFEMVKLIGQQNRR